MPKTLYTIAQSVKETPRLASIQDPETFHSLLKTRYTSELVSWLKIESKDSWKRPLLEDELKIRQLQKKIQALEAELW
jgi:hypothetical protein